jgi:pimeloyl-ACP methyl ester carboxylesterase
MINSFEKLKIGGIDQWVLVRGQQPEQPLLLILYGGPGVPLFPRVKDFGERVGLERIFTVAYWEQRGTGKSYSSGIPPESMTIEQFVADTLELADYLRSDFAASKICLLGESWGTVIGLLAVARAPECFHAYVGTGQVVHMLEADRISYSFVCQEAARRNNTKALRQLEQIGPPPYGVKEVMIERKWVGAFGGARHIGKPQSVPGAVLELLKTPQYSWGDILKVALHPFFSLKHLLDQLYQVNFFEQIPHVDIPVYFLEGRYDYTTPPQVVEKYFERLEAPKGKHFMWFENSAHFAFLEEPEKFYEVMANHVLKEVTESA